MNKVLTEKLLEVANDTASKTYDRILAISDLVRNKLPNFITSESLQESLNKTEMNWYQVSEFLYTLNSEGLFGYYDSSSGDYSEELLIALRSISLDSVADAFQKTFQLFPDSKPSSNGCVRDQQLTYIEEETGDEDLSFFDDEESEIRSKIDEIENALINYYTSNISDF